MTELVSFLIPKSVLVSHLILVMLVVLYFLSPRLWDKVFANLKKYSLHIGALVGLSLVFGSLFYSNVLLYEPCVLCWWQRVFIFPAALLALLALWFKDKSVYRYIVWLAVVAGVIALYQVYANFGGVSLLECTAEGGACSKVFVKEFGYITIPSMSLTASVYMILISILNKKND